MHLDKNCLPVERLRPAESASFVIFSRSSSTSSRPAALIPALSSAASRSAAFSRQPDKPTCSRATSETAADVRGHQTDLHSVVGKALDQNPDSPYEKANSPVKTRQWSSLGAVAKVSRGVAELSQCHAASKRCRGGSRYVARCRRDVTRCHKMSWTCREHVANMSRTCRGVSRRCREHVAMCRGDVRACQRGVKSCQRADMFGNPRKLTSEVEH